MLVGARTADRAGPEAIARHNVRIGTPLQRSVQRFVFLYALGPIGFVLVNTLFRVRVLGADHLHAGREGVIFAARHFYELDPALTFYGGRDGVWVKALRRRHFVTPSLASTWWYQTRLRRALSWVFGALIVERGRGQDQSALERAAQILEAAPSGVSVYPTGPVGRRPTFTVMPGVAWLALRSPQTVVLPITIVGVQDLRWRDVARLRRPRLTIGVGSPFRACELEGSPAERTAAICARIEREWSAYER